MQCHGNVAVRNMLYLGIKLIKRLFFKLITPACKQRTLYVGDMLSCRLYDGYDITEDLIVCTFLFKVNIITITKK
jgi:hypothetical protein